jgi:lipopolysaccharide/colanic/teichoic acid biosynthesis glycosyltransferase
MRVPLPTSRNGKRVYLSFWDLFWALASPLLALYLRDVEIPFRGDWSSVGYYWVLSSGFALLAFFALRIHDGLTRYFSVHQALDVAEAVLFAELMTCAVMFTVTRLDGIPRSMPLIHGLLLAGGLIGARLVVRIAFSQDDESADYNSRRERIILIGANPCAASFIQLLRTFAPQREPVIAVLDEDSKMIGRAVAGVQVIGAPDQLAAIISEFAIHGVDTDRVVIAGETDFLSPAVLQEIERICQKRQIALSFLPRMIGVTEWKAPEKAISVARPQPSDPLPAYFRVKRGIDVVGSLALTALFSPLFILAGLLVLVDVGTPILFWQERVGWRGRSFLIYKFRTLRAPFGAYGAPLVGGRLPSRVGRFLRASRFDELPQLLNVLFGDMSLIGPRPLLPEDQPANPSLRLSVRPGISGWAQINGAKLVTKEEKEKLDEWYVRNASLWVDLRIGLATLGIIFKSRLSSVEAAADVEQVHGKDAGISVEQPPAASSRLPAEARRPETVG